MWRFVISFTISCNTLNSIFIKACYAQSVRPTLVVMHLREELLPSHVAAYDISHAYHCVS